MSDTPKLNPDEMAWLEGFFTRYGEQKKKCSEWEQGFMDDQVKRFDEYGDGTRFSPRQWGVLDRVAEKLGYEGRGDIGG